MVGRAEMVAVLEIRSVWAVWMYMRFGKVGAMIDAWKASQVTQSGAIWR